MDKKDKLEILVVDDTPENLAVAKEFYNSQPDLHTDYATYRDEAISMLDNKKYDGVITDRSMPANKGESLKEGKNVHPEKVEGYYKLYSKNPIKICIPANPEHWGKHYDRNQGYLVAGIARLLKDTPVIIHSYHGTSSEFYEILSTSERTESQKKGIKTIFDQYSLPFERMLETNGAVQDLEGFFSNNSGEDWGDKNSCDLKYLGTERGITKKNPESWKIALDYLKQRIESRK